MDLYAGWTRLDLVARPNSSPRWVTSFLRVFDSKKLRHIGMVKTGEKRLLRGGHVLGRRFWAGNLLAGTLEV